MFSLFFLLIGSTEPGHIIPTSEQRMLLHRTEQHSANLSMPGGYWDEGHDFDVLDYDINMTVDVPHDTVWANVTIKSVALSEKLDTLRLNFHWSFKIDSIKEKSRSLSWKPAVLGSFKIALGREVQNGETLSVVVYYHGRPRDEKGGLTILDGATDSALVFTNCEPEGARNWIPCYDVPSDKATFTQAITVPSNYRVVANGTLDNSKTTGAWWTYTWREHYPQATYLISFAASKQFLIKDTFAVVEGNHVPMRAWVLESNDVRGKFDITPAILEHFSEIFPPYPFSDEKYDHVHAPIGGAMENTTCTFINTYANWGGGSDDWSWVIAHELSHDWWGDWLTCATWADIWLNEGFATYSEVLWWEKLYGFEGQKAYARYVMDTYLQYGDANPIYDPEELFGINSYEKGGSVLHMLRWVLGDSLFFAGLNTYALKNADESVITDDFQNTMEEVSKNDLDWFFDEWIYGGGHPYYKIGWELTPKTGGKYTVDFAVAQVQNQTSNYFPFRMPLEVAVYASGSRYVFSFTDSIGYQTFTVEAPSKPDSFRLDPDGKALFISKQYDNLDSIPYIPTQVAEVTNPVVSTSLVADAFVTDFLRVSFSQPSSELVSLSLYDASGRKVKAFYEGRSREFSRLYPVSDLGAGVYFLRLERSGHEPVSAKTVKIR